MINKKLFSDITKHNVSLRRGSGALSTVCGAVKLIFTAPVFLVQGSLTSPIFFKQTKQRQTCGEKFFICFAVVPVLSLPLAAASPAQREKRTFSALIADSKTLSYKIFRSFRLCRRGERYGIYVTQKTIVCTVEVARIYISVALYYKLVSTVSAQSALLRMFAQIHSDKVIKITYTYIISAHEILYVQIKNFDKISCVLLVGHVQLALALISERSQARDKLQILISLRTKMAVYLTGIFGARACQNGQNIELYAVFFKNLSSARYLVVRILSVGRESESVVFVIAVKA